jgi:glycerol-3-phosphate acyltransferase PlsY
VLELSIKFLICYFLGSFMGSLIVGKTRGGVDIRKLGSGNAGGTNALRTQGLAFALGVMVIDVGKGALATWFVPGIDLPFVGASAEISREWLTLSCAAAAVIGHVWPMWHQFRGGKGAATLVGTLAILAPAILLPVVGIWIVVLVITGYVGLSTILAVVASPVLISVMQLPDAQPVFIYCAVMAMYLLFSHRSNIVRMFRGEETQFRRVMIFRRRTE